VSDPLENLPTLPDKVVDQLRKGNDVPLEAVSETAAEMAEQAASERARPLHMEALQPITRQRARQIVSGSPDGKLQHGVMPRAPQSRRVIPRPFQRPSITLATTPGVDRKEWRYVKAAEVQEGDIVPDAGLVLRVERAVRYADAEDMALVVRDGGQVIQQLSEADSGDLEARFGDMRVAVGTDIRLHGPERVLELDAQAEVRVFR
jgi:hypothetical protein